MPFLKTHLLIASCLLGVYLHAQEIVHAHDQRRSFIENKGQWHPEVLFQSKIEGGNLWVQQHRFFYHFHDQQALHEAHTSRNPKHQQANASNIKQAAVHMNFIGSNEVKQIEKKQAAQGYYNYFIGNDKKKWASHVQAYSEALLKNLYDGVDLKLIEQGAQLKYEFWLRPQVPVSRIQLEFGGHRSIKINRQGDLVVETGLGQIIEEKPYSYQIVQGKIVQIPTRFILEGNKVRFELGEYRHDLPLVIDPQLIFATYNGAISDNFGMTATYGHDGTAYSGGTVFGNQFPLPDSATFDIAPNFTTLDGDYGITDVFITKYSPDGTQMLWSTFLGGGDDTQGTETVHSLICDEQDNLYFFGVTSSADFPLVTPYQNTFKGGEGAFFVGNGVYCHAGTDLYVAKLSRDGHQLLGSTYLGGTDNDGINYVKGTSAPSGLYHNYGDQFRGEIMLDSQNNIYLASCTYSVDFPTRNSIIGSIRGKQDGIICKLTNDCSDLLLMTYIGGSENDACYSIKIDQNGWMIFSGGTTSTDIDNFYTVGTMHEFYLGGDADGIVGKISPDGVSQLLMTYIGTANYDQAYFVEIDVNNKIFAYGQSIGGQFPVTNATFSNPGSGQYIARLDNGLSTIERSTIFGSGNAFDTDISPSAFLVDLCGNIYVSGWGTDFSAPGLNNMPVTNDAYLGSPPDGHDFYLMVMKREFDAVLYGTYMGGPLSPEHVDGGTSRYDKNGVVYQSVCGGCSQNSDFPTTPGAWSASNNSNNCNNLLFKFDFKIIGHADFFTSDTTSCAPLTITFTNLSTQAHAYNWDFGDGTTSSTDFNPTKTYTIPGNYEVILSIEDTLCPVMDTARFNITIIPAANGTVTSDTILCVPGAVDLTANSFGQASSFLWSSSNLFTDTLNLYPSDSVLSLIPNSAATYYVKYGNSECFTTDSVSLRVVSSEFDLAVSGDLCDPDSMLVSALDLSPFDFNIIWSPESLISSHAGPNAVYAGNQGSGYIVAQATASNGCSFRDSVYVQQGGVFGNGVFASASDTLVATGTSVVLTATPQVSNFNYQWSPVSGLSNPNSSQTNAVVNQTTTYVVQVTDGNCVRFDTVTVYCYSNICGHPEVYVPNAFSPNQQGKNEVFYVRGPQITQILLRVYDRWGEMVFESTDINHGWDGTFRGRKCDPDVYDYYLKVTCESGYENIIKGNVTLLK